MNNKVAIQQTGGSAPTTAPINVLLSGGLMTALLIFGLVLVRQNGIKRGVGVILLLLLVANIFNNSSFWITYVGNANSWLQNWQAHNANYYVNSLKNG